MDIVILGIIILLLIIIGYSLSAAVLTGLLKIFKIEKADFKKSLVIVFFSGLAGLIADAILKSIGLGEISNFLIAVILFAVFYYLLKKYYSVDWKKALGIYVAFSIITIILSFLIVLPVRSYVIQPFYVIGDSMSPNYNQDDYLLIGMIGRQFSRGDVVVFRNPKAQDQFSIKRIIGLPGEKVEIKNGNVIIDGQNLNEPYANGITAGNITWLLYNDEYYVLGDNRARSFDSRAYGPVEDSYILGKIIYNFTVSK